MLSSKFECTRAYNNVTGEFTDNERENPFIECSSTPGTIRGSGETA